MPVSEAERGFAPIQVNGGFESKPGSNWINTVDKMLAQRRAILHLTLAGILISAVVAFFYPKYQSQVQIMPPDGPPTGLASLAMPSVAKTPGLAGIASELLGGGKNSTAVFIKVLGSRTVEDYLVDRFDLRRHYFRRYYEDARDKLRSHTIITEDKKSGVVTLAFEDRDPKFAAAVAGAYMEELDRVVTKVATSSARRERVFVEQRLAEERQQLDASQKQFSAFASTTMALDVPQQTRVTVESAARLQGELIATKAQLEGLQQIYARENYRVKSLQAHVSELEKALSKLNSGPATSGSAQDPTNPYPSVRSLPQLGVQWTDLYRNIKIHETVYELLTQQYEMAKIQEAKEIPTVKILDPPSTPEKRYPRPWAVLLVGTLLSLLGSCLGVVLFDRWQTWDPADPRRALLVRMYRSARRSPQAAARVAGDHGSFEQRNGSGHEQPAPDRERVSEYSDRRL